MTDEPFVDTHVHFWDRSVADLQWAWLDSGFSGYRFDSGDGYSNASRSPTRKWRPPGSSVSAMATAFPMSPWAAANWTSPTSPACWNAILATRGCGG